MSKFLNVMFALFLSNFNCKRLVKNLSIIIFHCVLFTSTSLIAQPILYGVTSEGGEGAGTIYKYNVKTNSIAVKHSWKDTLSGNVYLTPGNDGQIYGVSSEGGRFNRGTIFKFDRQTKKHIGIYELNLNDGAKPGGAMILSPNGKMYGITIGRSVDQAAPLFFPTIFSFDLQSGAFQTIHVFNNSPAQTPIASITLGDDGKIYGSMTNTSIFSFDISSNSIQTLYNFSNLDSVGFTNGVVKKKNELWGAVTNNSGAGSSRGYIYSFDLTNSSFIKRNHFTIPDSYSSTTQFVDFNDSLIIGLNTQGGSSNFGAAFSFNTKSNRFIKLVDFSAASGRTTLSENIIKNGDFIYATSFNGGSKNAGTIFRVNPLNPQLQIVHNFDSIVSSSPKNSICVIDNQIYGVSNGGASFIGNCLYSLDLSNLQYVHQLNIINEKGGKSLFNLNLYEDGLLYGSSTLNGFYGAGNIFSYNPITSEYKILHQNTVFNSPQQSGSWVKAPNGKFYGASYFSGKFNKGSIFSFDPRTRIFETLVSLYDSIGSSYRPNLVLGFDNLIYGTTDLGGINALGTIFTFDYKSNLHKKIYDFNLTNVRGLRGGMVEISNGTFIGATWSGRSLFKFTRPSNSLTVLRTDIDPSYGGLTKSKVTGKYYGTSLGGGLNGYGVLFSIDPNTLQYDKIIDFSSFYKNLPSSYTTLYEARNGILYGTTSTGDSLNNLFGTIFSFNPAVNEFKVLKSFNYETGFGLSFFSSFVELGTCTFGYNPFPDTIKTCDKSVELDAGNNYIEYIWSTGDSTQKLSANQSGLYHVTAMHESGCTVSDSIFISIPFANIIQRDTSICKGASIELKTNILPNLPVSLKNGLIAQYLFDGNGLDNSTNSLNATLNGVTSVIGKDGKQNGAFDFTINGWNLGTRLSEAFIPYNPRFKTPTFTLSAWIKPRSYGYPGSQGTIINMYQEGYNNPNGQVYKLEIGDFDNSGRLTATVLGTSSNNSQQILKNVSAVIPLNVWTHVLVTFDGNNLSTYINGDLSNKVIKPNGFVFNQLGTSGISIGVSNQANGYWYPFDGAIDEVSIWDRPLSDNEILSINNKSNNKSIKWSTGDTTSSIRVSPLVTTNYTLTTSDGITTCTDQITVTVNQIDTSLILLDKSYICQGGTVRLQAGSGSSYRWLKEGIVIGNANSRILNVTTPGSYRAIISNTAGCFDTTNAIIIKERILPDPPVLESTKFCNGDTSAKFSISTGINNRVKWYLESGDSTQAPRASDLISGKYRFLISQIDSFGCESTKKEMLVDIINRPNPPTANPIEYCLNGQSKALNATSGINSILNWYGTSSIGGTKSSTPPIPSTLKEGVFNYYVSQLDSLSKCESDRSVIRVTINPIPSRPTIVRSNSMLLSSAPLGNQWLKNGELIAGATDTSYKPIENGQYSLQVTLKNCISPTAESYYFITTGLSNIDQIGRIKISPNPAKTQLFIESRETQLTGLSIEIYDLKGGLLMRKPRFKLNTTLDVGHLNNGVYLFVIKSNDSQIIYQTQLIKSQ